MKKALFITGSFLVVIVAFYFITGLFITCNKPIKSNNLLIEGWVPRSTLEEIAKYILHHKIDSIYVVGMKYRQHVPVVNDLKKKPLTLKRRYGRYSIPWDGTLGFILPAFKNADSLKINIGMFGHKALDYYPHYKIFANDTFLGSGFVRENDSTYCFQYRCTPSDSLVNLKISFDNDTKVDPEDRNLYVSDIKINHLNIDSIVQHSYFIYHDTRLSFSFNSNAVNTKLYLADIGIDTNKIKEISTDFDDFNKTLALARRAADYFNQTKISDINIITTTNHSRRTYLNFKGCLHPKIKVGCIPAPYINEETHSTLYRNVDERVSMFITWIYWWFH